MVRAIKIAGGEEVYIEVDDSVAFDTENDRMVGGVAGPVDTVIDKMTEIGESIGRVCSAIKEHADEAMQKAKPEELQVEFAVKLAGKAGVPLVTQGSAEGTVKVTAKWKYE